MTVGSSFESKTQFKFIRVLGYGGSSTVALYSRITPGFPPMPMAVKLLQQFDLDANLKAELVNEGTNLNQLNHPNIVRCYGFEEMGKSQWGLLLEYIRGCSLAQIIPVLSNADRPAIAAFVAHQLGNTISYLHKNNYIHGDISARNVLLSHDGELKLGDFGLANNRKFQKNRLDKGSPDYLSPEVWKTLIPTPSSDIFSFGIIIWEILTGTNPLRKKSIKESKLASERFLKEKPWAEIPAWSEFFQNCFVLCQLPLNLQIPSPDPGLNSQKKLGLIASSFAEQQETKLKMATIAIPISKKHGVLGSFLTFITAMVLFTAPSAVSNFHPQGFHKSYTLSVTSMPWGAVYVDKRFVGHTPVINLKLPEGPHTIKWVNKLGQIVERQLIAFKNGSGNLDINAITSKSH